MLWRQVVHAHDTKPTPSRYWNLFSDLWETKERSQTCVQRIYSLSYALVPPQNVAHWYCSQQTAGQQGTQFSVCVSVWSIRCPAAVLCIQSCFRILWYLHNRNFEDSGFLWRDAVSFGERFPTDCWLLTVLRPEPLARQTVASQKTRIVRITAERTPSSFVRENSWLCDPRPFERGGPEINTCWFSSYLTVT